MVVILDDEDRENEGDLVMAAEKVRPEDINFMVREARGLVCLTLTSARCRQLGLKPMVHNNTSSHHTNCDGTAGISSGRPAQAVHLRLPEQDPLQPPVGTRGRTQRRADVADRAPCA
jgi:hypothetical protein